jgi:hypothetical protein
MTDKLAPHSARLRCWQPVHQGSSERLGHWLDRQAAQQDTLRAVGRHDFEAGSALVQVCYHPALLGGFQFAIDKG